MALDLIASKIVDDVKSSIAQLASIPPEDRIEALNNIKMAMHAISPMSREPVDCVIWVPGDSLRGNDYNPNSVATPEMDLLKLSIMADGYTQPIVAWPAEDGGYEVVDGFHRNRVGKEVAAVKKRVFGHLPISVINADRTAKEDRVAATIRHNRARGKHSVNAMSELVVDLSRRNWSDQKIAKELGMEPDEVLRLKQVSGLAELFAGQEFSEAWEVE